MAGGDPDNSPRCLSRQPQGTQSAGPRSAEGAQEARGTGAGRGRGGGGAEAWGRDLAACSGPARAGIRRKRGEDAEGRDQAEAGGGAQGGGVAWAPGPPDGKRAAAGAGPRRAGAGPRVTGRDRGWALPARTLLGRSMRSEAAASGPTPDSAQARWPVAAAWRGTGWLAHRRYLRCRGLAITLLVLPTRQELGRSAFPPVHPGRCLSSCGVGRTGKVKHVCCLFWFFPVCSL